MNNKKCPVCNLTNVRNKIDYLDWRVFKCSDCGFRFADGGTPVVLDEHYDEIYFEPLIQRDEMENWSRRYRKRLDYAEQWAPNKKLLEVGAGASIFAKVAADRGFDVNVVDGSSAAVKILSAYDGVSGWVEDLNTCEFPKNTYGVIHSSHVIEHLGDPVHFLENCLCALTKGGVLILSFPVYEGRILAVRDSLYMMGLTNHPYNYQAPDHVSYFDVNCIRKTLEKVGFEVVSLRRTKFVSLNLALGRMQQNSLPRKALSRFSNWLRLITDKIGFYRDVEIVAKHP